MIYESRITRRNRYKLSASQLLSPDKIVSDRLDRLSRGSSMRRSFNKNIGNIVNKDTQHIDHTQKTLEKIYQRMDDLSSGKMRH